MDLNYSIFLITGTGTLFLRIDASQFVLSQKYIFDRFVNKIAKAEISSLHCPLLIKIADACRQYSELNNKWIVLPLHSTLSLAEQEKVFDYPPEGVRKVVMRIRMIYYADPGSGNSPCVSKTGSGSKKKAFN